MGNLFPNIFAALSWHPLKRMFGKSKVWQSPRKPSLFMKVPARLEQVASVASISAATRGEIICPGLGSVSLLKTYNSISEWGCFLSNRFLFPCCVLYCPQMTESWKPHDGVIYWQKGRAELKVNKWRHFLFDHHNKRIAMMSLNRQDVTRSQTANIKPDGSNGVVIMIKTLTCISIKHFVHEFLIGEIPSVGLMTSS